MAALVSLQLKNPAKWRLVAYLALADEPGQQLAANDCAADFFGWPKPGPPGDVHLHVYYLNRRDGSRVTVDPMELVAPGRRFSADAAPDLAALLRDAARQFYEINLDDTAAVQSAMLGMVATLGQVPAMIALGELSFRLETEGQLNKSWDLLPPYTATDYARDIRSLYAA